MRRAAVVAFLLLAAAPTASAVVVHTQRGQFFGLMPHRKLSPAAVRKSIQGAGTTTSSTSGNLNYHSGPVVHSSAPYLIFWTPAGESVPSSWQTLLERYFTDAAADSGKGSNVYAVGRQYTDGSGFANAARTFSSSQVIVDTQPYPARDSANCPNGNGAYATCVTDDQLQQEVDRVVSADGLPTDGPSSSKLPANAPIYFVVLPSAVNECFPPNADGSIDCADNSFCAYHSSATDGAANVLYAAIPTLVLGGGGQDPKSCQADGNSAVQEPNATPADVVLTYLSHEDNETITDPFGTGWWNSNSGNEGGDNCNITGSFSPANGTNPNAFLPTLGASTSPTLYDQALNGDDYYIQSEWSNGEGNCELQPTGGTITPQFTAPSGTDLAGSALSFDPSASSSTYSLTSATWSWGDGTTTFSGGASSLAAVSHTYAKGGTYTVTLTLVDNRGNAASTTRTIAVYPIAAFTYSPTSPLRGSAVTFDASSSAEPGGTIENYAWSFGDGATGSGVRPAHTYANAGTYTVQLTVTDSGNRTSTTSQQLTVLGPRAAFTSTPSQPVDGQPVAFDGRGSSDPEPGQAITAYSWSFGDGSTGSGAQTTHAYRDPGAYTATLTVTNGAHETDTTSHVVTVADAAPTAAFSADTASPASGQAVQFDGSASAPSDPNASIAAYSWNFGDGSVGTGRTITHAFAAPGVYTVRLTVTDSYNATSSVSETLTVQAPPSVQTADQPPTAVLSIATAHPVTGQPVGFSATGSSDADGTVVSYGWSFGDGATATATAPSHSYAKAGSYTVSLTVTDSAGLSATAMRTVTVAPSGRITNVAATPSRGGAILRVTVTTPGTLIAGRRVLHLRRAGTVRFAVKLTPAQLRAVRVRHQLKVRIALRFIPVAGPVARRTAVVAFRPR